MAPHFSHQAAFDRNIGWLTEWEQVALRAKRVAIAGMGGVGGFHLLTLARLGVGAFNIADLDRFEIANFNRQVGASMASLDRPKVEVLAEMARGINPQLDIRMFSSGVQPELVDDFLSGADLFIDGFDFFVLDIRRKVFRRCAELGIPALTAAPVGMGVGLVGFTKESMDFETYFRFQGRSELRQYVHFLLGMAPSGIHRAYLVDPGRLDFARKRAPSTIVGVQLAASATAAAAIKLLLRRKGFKPAPWHHHYDAYLGKVIETKLRWGNAGPLQSRKADAAEKVFASLSRRPAKVEVRPPANRLEEIIDLARWTPSGDNSQPWRFVVVSDDSLQVYVRKAEPGNIYEYHEGEPTLLSAGMLLASLRIAASHHHLAMQWAYAGDRGGWHRVDVEFVHGEGMEGSPLWGAMPMRSVDRRPYKLRKLRSAEKQALLASLGGGLDITWLENNNRRIDAARLNAAATDIRLRIPETFEIHRQCIAWDAKFSPDRMPAAALGLDRTTLSIMRWAMADRERLDRLNRFLGTGMARMQLDYMPGFFCAAHFSIQANLPARESGSSQVRIEKILKAGEALQRFWLTATQLGLAMQPSLAPLAFLAASRPGTTFSKAPWAVSAGKIMQRRTAGLLPDGGIRTIFLGRIGEPRGPIASRSLRLPLEALILDRPPTAA